MIPIFLIVIFFCLLLFIFCLAKTAGQTSRQEDDRQQLLFLEAYRREHPGSHS